MTADELFLLTFEDLEERVTLGRGEYDALMSAWLLRKLLLDEQPLVHRANRSRRLKLKFRMYDDRLLLELRPGAVLALVKTPARASGGLRIRSGTYRGRNDESPACVGSALSVASPGCRQTRTAGAPTRSSDTQRLL